MAGSKKSGKKNLGAVYSTKSTVAQGVKPKIFQQQPSLSSTTSEKKGTRKKIATKRGTRKFKSQKVNEVGTGDEDSGSLSVVGAIIGMSMISIILRITKMSRTI